VNFFESLHTITKEQISALPRLLTRREKTLALICALVFIGSLASILLTLGARYSTARPAFGGTLREGVIGIPRFINPLLAVSDVDRDLTSVVYRGLMKFDGTGNIVPALAEHYEISEDGTEYTFTLRDGIRWSDGKPISTNDILFTINLAKNPLYRSQIRANWEGVGVEKTDERTIRFKLQKPYAPFLENTILGILPEHIWKDISPQEFALSEYNLKPVGAGPYKAVSFQKNATGRIISYAFEQNPYLLPQKAYIKNLEFYFYPSESELVDAFHAEEFDSVSSLPAHGIPETEQKSDVRIIRLNLPRVFGVFFNQNASKALADAAVREALELAANKKLLVEQVLENQGVVVYAPIPPGTFGSIDPVAYEDRAYELERAKTVLKNAGWADHDSDGILEKTDAKKETILLTFTLSTSNSPSLVETAKLLQTMWREAGIGVEVKVFELGDFEQNVLRTRKYDALLFGEVVGYDPDPFAFWHSSQRNDPGLNIAFYTNPKVDTLLEKARSTINPDERRTKYEEFQQEIKKDNPAVFLYSPLYLYAIPTTLHGADFTHITIPSDRFSTIDSWYIKTKKIPNIFSR